jgi:hypothetical protein
VIVGRPSIIPELKAKLEAWLDARMAQWEAQAAGHGAPTLPVTEDGKVNVRALTLALGLRISQEQHFYKHLELRNAVNAVAEAQGLKPIGSRAGSEAEDKALTARINRIEEDRNHLARTLAEREALIERQRREIEALREQLGLLEETGMLLRTRDVT